MKKRLISLLLAASLLLCGCSGTCNNQKLNYTDVLFDTVISIDIYDNVDTELLNECKELCLKYDSLLSRTNEESEIYKINHANSEFVKISAETLELINHGLHYSELSEGAFDITIGAASSLWDFKSEDHIIPDEDKILSAVDHIDYHCIEIKNDSVRLTDPNAMLDLGAIAKGYIADKLKEHLVENGVEHALINLGGNILIIGSKPDGSNYNIGIQKPFDQTGQPITSVKVSDTSLVTTGIYERCFEKNDILYHHILDPSTGYPCENNLYSVTIVTESSVMADALSTSCFLLGFEKGMKLINKLEGVEALFITNNYEMHYSDNF